MAKGHRSQVKSCLLYTSQHYFGQSAGSQGKWICLRCTGRIKMDKGAQRGVWYPYCEHFRGVPFQTGYDGELHIGAGSQCGLG